MASVKGYEKSIIIGGIYRLWPLTVENIPALVDVLKAAVKSIKDDAYQRGYKQAQKDMQRAIGVEK